MRYVIENVKTAVGEGGFACGPVDGPVVCEVTLRDEEGNSEYHSLIEAFGCPHFYCSTESCFQDFLEEDEEMIEELNNAGDCFCDYDEVFDDLQSEDDDTIKIWRYLIYMVRANWDDVAEFEKVTIGKYIDQITIPASDVEEEYMEE